MPTISTLYDIKSLIERYANIDVVGRPTTVRGVTEYHSNCPWCGGADRFVTRPETGQFSCAIRSSGCGRTGDGIDFLKEYMNMSHAEACEILGIEQSADFVPSKSPALSQSGKEAPPCKTWQSAGLNLVERAEKALWTSAGQDMLRYLHARGLGDEIIKKKRLGYVPLQSNGRFYEASLESWGLDPLTCAKDAVRVPTGILIPWFEGDTLWRLALKRPGEKKGQDYGQVLGSGEGLFNVDSIQYDKPAMMTEAEFCAMCIEQECGDIVACVATGSTTRARLSRWVAELHLASFVLQSFDEDEGGDTGSEYWNGRVVGGDGTNEIKGGSLKRCYRWSPWVAKDPNDILLKKFFPDATPCTLREWVEAGVMIGGI